MQGILRESTLRNELVVHNEVSGTLYTIKTGDMMKERSAGNCEIHNCCGAGLSEDRMGKGCQSVRYLPTVLSNVK